MTLDTEAAVANEQSEAADRIIRNCSLASIGAGVLPFPVIDIIALGGVQVYLISDLCKIYNVQFKKERAKTILSAIVGGVAPAAVAPLAIAAVKIIPIVGQTLGALSMPALTATSTLAVGRIFKRHFEAGGNLDDVNVDEMKAEYTEEVETETAAKARSKKTAEAAA